MINYNHINREQRDIINHLINQGKSFTYIGDAISKDRTAISREVRRNRYLKSNRFDAFDIKDINLALSKCKKLSKPPYVCNTCPKKNTCGLHHLYYNSKIAQDNYDNN